MSIDCKYGLISMRIDFDGLFWMVNKRGCITFGLKVKKDNSITCENIFLLYKK